MPTISVIGSFNMDLIVQVARMPLPGETIAGSGFRLVPGGKGANQAVASAKAGAQTHMYGCVGSDAFGTELLNSLIEAGVNVSKVTKSTKESSGVATILLENSGENRIIIIPGSNNLVDNTYIENNWHEISKSDLIVIQHEIPIDTCHNIIDSAHHASIPVLFNPAPFYPTPDEVLKKIEYLVVNETELQGLIGFLPSSEEELVLAGYSLLEKGVKTLIITLGQDGSILLSNGIEMRQSAFTVEAVDTTAAGDTYVGYLATAILNGKDFRSALEFASAAAALAVTKIGAQSSIPSIEETLNFIKKNKILEGEL